MKSSSPVPLWSPVSANEKKRNLVQSGFKFGIKDPIPLRDQPILSISGSIMDIIQEIGMVVDTFPKRLVWNCKRWKRISERLAHPFVIFRDTRSIKIACNNAVEAVSLQSATDRELFQRVLSTSEDSFRSQHGRFADYHRRLGKKLSSSEVLFHVRRLGERSSI